MERGNNKNAVLLTVIGIATLLVAIVGATFAYFSATVVYDDESSTLTIVSASGGTSTYYGGDDIIIENIYPRSAAWVQKTIKIDFANTTLASPYEYSLSLDYNSTFPNNYLTYEFKAIPSTAATGVCLSDGSKTTAEACGTALIKSTNNTGDVLMATTAKTGALQNGTGSIDLSSGTNGAFAQTAANATSSHVYLLTIWFLNGNANQNDAQNKTLTARVVYHDINTNTTTTSS